MRMSQKPENPPGHENRDEEHPNYTIDETITLPKDDRLETWDLDVDPEKEEKHVIRAIARTNSTQIQAYILPKEEVEFIESGENVWWEYRSSKTGRLKDSTLISPDDEDPYYHEGDYVLAIRGIANHGAPDELKVTVKFRRE